MQDLLWIAIMIGLVAADYLFGRLIGVTRVEAMRKLWLVLAIVSNLGVLGFYKYLGFFIETLNTVFNVSVPTVSVTMPSSMQSWPSQFASSIQTPSGVRCSTLTASDPSVISWRIVRRYSPSVGSGSSPVTKPFMLTSTYAADGSSSVI